MTIVYGHSNRCLISLLIFLSIKLCQTRSTAFAQDTNNFAIRGLKQLQALHMQKNNIDTLEALSFLNLPVLNLLNLAGNNISEINRQAFLNVPQLKYLYLTNNRISHLIPHQFASFDQIEMIDLTGNNITEIPNECMAQLSQLRQLFLGGNHIRTIGKDAFANSSIVILSLINNELTEITEGMLDGMPNLQSIAFKNNKIRSIHHNAFYNTPSIIMIDLSNNEIVDLSPSTFLVQLNLQMIDLRNNKILRTPYAALNHRIGTVFLQENPLVCKEKIHMLQDGLAVYIATSEDIICGKRTTTTTTTVTPPPVMMKKLSPRRPSTADATPSGAFQQNILFLKERQQLPKDKPASVHLAEKQSPPLLPRNITRTRGPHQRDMSYDRLPVQAKEFSPNELQSIMIQPIPVTERNESTDNVKDIDEEEVNLTTQSSRLQNVDNADNPNIIYPFPVPFLKKPQGHREAIRVKPVTESSPTFKEQHTLPPSVVLMPKTRSNITESLQNIDNSGILEQFALESHLAVQKDKNMTGNQQPTTTNRATSPAFIIILCMVVVAMVMVSVIIGLCILRHRHLTRFPSSSSYGTAEHTNAYISAQAAQMNVIYGTMDRNQQINLHRSDDVYPWLHNPGHTYCNYYK